MKLSEIRSIPPTHRSFQFDLLSVALVTYIVAVLVFDFTLIYRIALVAMLFTVLLFDRSWLHQPISSITYAYGGLLLYFFCHTYFGFTTASEQSEAKLLTMFLTFIGIVLVTHIIRVRQAFSLVMNTVIVCAFILSGYTLVMLRGEIFNDLAWLSIPKLFFPGLAYVHNDIPTVLAFAVFFLRYKLAQKKSTSSLKIFSWFSIVIFTLLVILSGARKALICVVFALVIYPIFISGNRKAIITKLIRIAFLLFLLYIVCINIDFLYNAIGYRFEAVIHGVIYGDFSSEASARYRDHISDIALAHLKENWLLGYGLDSFGVRSSYGGWTENTYLDLWYSGGIFAIVIYLAYFVYAVIRIQFLRRRRTDDLLYQSLAVWMIVNSYVTVAYPSRLLYFIPCLISAYIAVGSVENRKTQNSVVWLANGTKDSLQRGSDFHNDIPLKSVGGKK